MARSMKSQDLKREYIDVTFRLLEEEGLSAVSIRRVTSELGVSSAALYRHFSSVEELILYASIRFLSDYASDLQVLAKVDLNPIQLDFQMWECLAYYAFKNPSIFDNFFFGPSSNSMNLIFQDYYLLYPEDLAGQKDYVISMMENSDVFAREQIMLARSAISGFIRPEDIDFLTNVNVYLFRGMLSHYRDYEGNEQKCREGTRLFLRTIVKNFNAHLIEGNEILTVAPLNKQPHLGFATIQS